MERCYRTSNHTNTGSKITEATRRKRHTRLFHAGVSSFQNQRSKFMGGVLRIAPSCRCRMIAAEHLHQRGTLKWFYEVRVEARFA